MRTIEHPGETLMARRSSVVVELAPAVRVVVEEGDDLFETVHGALDRRGASGGSFTLVAGIVDSLFLMTGGPGRDKMPMDFYGPHQLAAPLSVVAGAAGSGIDLEGSRFTHCHAAFRDRAGRLVGGHLLLGQTIAGKGGVKLDLVPIQGGRFARRVDPETLFTIFHPEIA